MRRTAPRSLWLLRGVWAITRDRETSQEAAGIPQGRDDEASSEDGWEERGLQETFRK